MRVAVALLIAFALKDLPQKIDPDAHYLFYLHGRIIEDQGVRPKHPQYGYYEYEQIVKTFEARGFVVISEPRAKGTEPAAYAGKVVRMVQRLLKAGVPDSHISVIGASKGALIAMLVSTELKNQNVKFVILANCNEWVAKSYPIRLSGEVLSIYEKSDEIGGSCKEIFSKSPGLRKSNEVRLHMGNGHGFIFRPHKEWIDPAVAWCKQIDS